MKTSVALIKTSFGFAGGLEKQARRIKRAFEDAGCRVTLITADSLHLKRKPLSFQNIKNFDRACSDHLARSSYNCIFTMDRIRMATHIRAGNGCHAAYLNHRKRFEPLYKTLTFPLNPLHRLLLDLEKKSFENPRLKRLITNSQMVKQEILQHYSIPEEKISVIYNGVEWNELTPSYKSNEKFHFLFVGSGFKRKGLDLLLLALAHLSQKDWQLSVVGYDRNLTHYLQLAEKLKIQNQVQFFGKRVDIQTFYQKADCLVLPTLYDPFANTTVEALAMGLTVVTSKTNGGHEVLTPETGIIIEDLTSQDSLLAALQKALTRPKTEERAKKIRNTVKSYTFENQLSALTKICLENSSFQFVR
ncbi:MAG: glycosyltransferase family 4 protein [Candidatus Algichlamydia australiensis]|nr:glycosyltransferase family 4 protein [Chlamydiales bacterium]